MVDVLVLAVLALVLWHKLLHALYHVVNVAALSELDDIVDVIAHVEIIIFAHLRNHNLLIVGLDCVLLVVEQFLIELLAWAQANLLNLDIDVRTQARQRNHACGEVVDAHRLPHVEDIDLTAMPHATSLEHERACLGDGHEVTDDVAVSDGDRTSIFYLLAEQRNVCASGTGEVSAPLVAFVSALPGVAIVRGMEPEMPACHTTKPL